jgi:L-rhamnonate dehydratase
VSQPYVKRIEWARLEGQRPRHAGKNARLEAHGVIVRPPIARVTLSDGSSGFGISYAGREASPREAMQPVLGQPLESVFSGQPGPPGPLDYPLWDLAARRAGKPVYALAAEAAGVTPPAAPPRVPCYDTSLYFDDLHLDSHEAAAELMAQEARQGYERGHRAFKIKVGRGARHLPLEAGTQRDIAVIRAVRQAVGPQPRLMVDANNGYNLNLAKRVLEETAECRLFWIEEAFHEDPVLYRDLKEWLASRGISTLIADGEGTAAPALLDWARNGIVDVVQYDYASYGFSRWLLTGRRLDEWGARTAPHHYGGHYGNYASGHLAGAIRGFTFVEWDEATTPGLDGSAYTVQEGHVTLPELPGFGVRLEESAFRRAVQDTGFTLEA